MNHKRRTDPPKRSVRLVCNVSLGRNWRISFLRLVYRPTKAATRLVLKLHSVESAHPVLGVICFNNTPGCRCLDESVILLGKAWYSASYFLHRPIRVRPSASTVYDRIKQDEDGDNIRYFWCCYRPVYCFATKVRPMSSYSESWSKSRNRAGVRIGL